MRRFKYLEKMFEEQIKKVFTYMKRYSDEDRVKLAKMTALWICNGSLPPSCLAVVAAVSECLIAAEGQIRYVNNRI